MRSVARLPVRYRCLSLQDHSEANGPSRAQCARRGRQKYLIYLPCAAGGEQSGGGGGSDQQKSRGPCVVDLGKKAAARIDLRDVAGVFQVEWYRARDGASRQGKTIPGGDFRTITSPWQAADVVARLLLDEPREFMWTDIVDLKGGRADYPESTLFAYQRNLQAGLSLDIDIRKTADGDIVAFHDETTGRTADKDWRVADKTVAELKTLDAAYRFDPAVRPRSTTSAASRSPCPGCRGGGCRP